MFKETQVAAKATNADPPKEATTINLRNVPGGDRYASLCFFLMVGVYLTLTALEVGYFFFGMTAFLEPYKTIVAFGSITPAVFQGELWRPLTATFMHAAPLHIGLNLLAFGVIHRFLKNFYAGRSWFWIFILSGYFGGIFAAAFASQPVIGASTGIMGMLGAILAAPLRHKQSGLQAYQLPSRNIPVKPLFIGLLMQLLLDNLVPQISGSAHIGGFISGFALAFIFPVSTVRSLVGSRKGIIKITAVNDKGDRRFQPSFEEVTFEPQSEFDRQTDYLAIVSGSHGGFIGKQPSISHVLGRRLTAKDLAGSHVFATEHLVPGYPTPATTIEEEAKPTTLQRIIEYFTLTVTWYVIARLLAPALLIPAPDTAWVKLLPADWQESATWYGEFAGLVLLSYVLANLVAFLTVVAMKRLTGANKPSA